MSDADILSLIRQGRDHQAFVKLYAHLPMVERMIRQNSGTKADAKDVFQDALIIFHRKAKTEDFQLTSAISTFLYSVCRNLWRDELRRRDKTLTNWEVREAADDPADISALLAQESGFKLAEQALTSLGDKCLEVLRRFYIAKESLIDIAKALGFAGEGAAKTRKYKCLEEARKRYRRMTASAHAAEPQHA
ncbi:MAG: sigma-70 family RNA polymerase sigma factor [Flavobacteriales bacterium]|nr:MAG: sigma-70 family RNA polymerase sigma factor [Flavobacteriales bacterium]